jgi:hypothetical protein
LISGPNGSVADSLDEPKAAFRAAWDAAPDRPCMEKQIVGSVALIGLSGTLESHAWHRFLECSCAQALIRHWFPPTHNSG